MKFSPLANLALNGAAILKPLFSLAIIAGFVSIAGGAETETITASDRSLSEIMATIVTPASDVIWNAVVFDVTAEGETLTGPASEEQWNIVRASAENLVAAAAKMLSEDLPIRLVEPVESPPGELNSQQIADLRAANWQAWAAHVNLLHAAGTSAINRIDARDVKGLSDAGNSLYEACDSCHMKFWYPEG